MICRLLTAFLALLLAVLAQASPVRADPSAPAATALQDRRAAWLWENRLWRTGAADLLDRAQALKIDTLFIALDIRDGKLRYRAELRHFLRAAHGRGISVLAVEGDPHMVLPAGQPNAIARAKAIRNYQLSVVARERLDGLQYDIEPYTLPNFDTNNPDHLRKWSDTYRLLRQAYAHKLDIVLPFWIADKPAGAAFVRQAAVHATGLATMAYRTEKDRIISAAMPLLKIGTELDLPVRVALEMGPTNEGPSVSFEGDLPALLKAMRQTLPVLARQDGFAGFAIHGIVWPGQEPP
jgi:hypothetical protein